MSINSNDPVLSSKLPVRQEKPKSTIYKDRIVTIDLAKKSMRRANIDEKEAANWKARGEVGKFASQQGSDEIALTYLLESLENLKGIITQCEEILAKQPSEAVALAKERLIVNCHAEITKVCERIQAHKKNLPNDPVTLAQKVAGPPPRSSVTAQQVNVVVHTKETP